MLTCAIRAHVSELNRVKFVLKIVHKLKYYHLSM